MNSKSNGIPTSPRKKFDQLWHSLKQDRDEMHLKMHLAPSDIRDEWEELEEKWKHLNRQAHPRKNKPKAERNTTKEPREHISESWYVLLDDIKTGYSRIRQELCCK